MKPGGLEFSHVYINTVAPMAPVAGEWVFFAHRAARPQQTATAFSPQMGPNDLNAAIQPQDRAGMLAWHWDVPETAPTPPLLLLNHWERV